MLRSGGVVVCLVVLCSGCLGSDGGQATYGDLPPEYRSPECRPEGELDIDPAGAGPWDY